MKPPGTAVVLGATGHIGSSVVRELLARGVRVTAATRRPRATPNLRGLDVVLSPGDADDPCQLDAWVAGQDLVVDAAAPYPVWMFRPTHPSEADPQGYARQRTARLLRVVERRRARLAVVGSFTTLPHPGVLEGDLEPRLLARSHPYFGVKRTIESMVLRAAAAGVPALVVNPAAFLGPFDLKERAHCFLPAVLEGRVPLTTDRVASFIDVRDAAASLVNAVWAERWSERIPLAGHNVPVDSLMRAACDMYGVRAPRLPASTRLGAALGYLAEAAAGVVGRAPPFPALPLLLIRYAYPMERSPAQRALGVPLRPLSTTLRDAIAWYESIGHLRPRR